MLRSDGAAVNKHKNQNCSNTNMCNAMCITWMQSIWTRTIRMIGMQFEMFLMSIYCFVCWIDCQHSINNRLLGINTSYCRWLVVFRVNPMRQSVALSMNISSLAYLELSRSRDDKQHRSICIWRERIFEYSWQRIIQFGWLELIYCPSNAFFQDRYNKWLRIWRPLINEVW